MNLRPYQNEAKERIHDEWKLVQRTLLVLPTGCHDPEQEILMFDGSLKKAKDIHAGEFLMGPDSTPRIVIKIHEGESEMVKVTPVKGDPFVVTEDHIMTFCSSDGIYDEVISNWFNWSYEKKESHTLLRVGVDNRLPSNFNASMSYLRPKFKVEKIGRGKFTGFTVDKDCRYLMGDTTVSHNCGKTIVFCKLIEDLVRKGGRILILAHRGELLEQAADKMQKATGLKCAVEKAEETALGSWLRITVGSVQSMMRENRLKQFKKDHYTHIIVDETHHILADSYQRIFEHFNNAKVLGVTATPDRTDRKNLGQFFDTKAFEYTLPQAIKDGFLVPIKALTIPLKLDLSQCRMQSGDFRASDVASALDPYLIQIVEEMKKHCLGKRKVIVFLPLIATSQKMNALLNKAGFKSVEVNGETPDRKEKLKAFESDEYDVLTNSMLVTEGYDCPAVDCIIMLRATKSRSLYCQAVGRGTRLSPETGKEDLLLLDFLWNTQKHELCRPANLIAEEPEVAKKMTEKLEEEAGCMLDLEGIKDKAESDCVADREEALAKKLEELKKKKGKLVDPLQYEMSIQDKDLSDYVPNFGWEMAPASDKQKDALIDIGIHPDSIDNAGKATLLLDKLKKRREAGLATPKQIRQLEGRGFQHVGNWTLKQAGNMITQISANHWRTPKHVNPKTYIPKPEKPAKSQSFSERMLNFS